MDIKLKKIIAAGTVLIMLVAFSYPPEAEALHGTLEGQPDFRFHFGFPIGEKFDSGPLPLPGGCECNATLPPPLGPDVTVDFYRPGLWGLPRPLPPVPPAVRIAGLPTWVNEFEFPGPLVDLPSSARLMWDTLFDPALGLEPPEERAVRPIEENEYVLGNTHNPILGGPFCVNLEIEWALFVPVPTCKPYFGWLWRLIGSSGATFDLAERVENIENLDEEIEKYRDFYDNFDFEFGLPGG